MKLDAHKKHDITINQKKEVKQEYKFIGTLKKRKGMFLFALNTDNLTVFKVELHERKVFDVQNKNEKSFYKAYINPKYPLVYAINIKNAKRKFKKKFGINKL